MTDKKIEQIARMCHEANRAYCRSIGDNSQPDWEEAPPWQKDSAYLGVLFHINNPTVGASASHDSWSAQKLEDGWTHGRTKDAEKKTHPCLVPFDKLPQEQQMKDYIFRGIVHAMKEGHGKVIK